MPSQNSVYIMGHLGRDAETKFTSNGHSITTFSVALTEKRGESEKTVWAEVKAWNLPAEAMNTLTKGRLVQIFGKLDSESWTDKDSGKKRSKMLVVATTVAPPYWERKESKAQAAAPAAQPPAQQQQFEATNEDVPW